MNKTTTPEFHVVRVRDGVTQYLAHQGHEHYWTTDKSSAMVYTRKDVADALAAKYVGRACNA